MSQANTTNGLQSAESNQASASGNEVRDRGISPSFGDSWGASSRTDLATLFVDEALSLLFPTRCLGCDVAGVWFCEACRTASELTASLDFCQLCGRAIDQPGALCSFHQAATGLTGLVSYANYHAAPIRTAIHLMKYEGIWAGLPVLSLIAWQSRWRYLRGHTWSAVLPIPLHSSRLRNRGYNQSELLARPLRQRLTAPHPLHLIRATATVQQVGLRRADRLHNLTNAFRWTGPPLTGRVLVVDDVVTTGATLMSAATTLRQHGATEVWAATLAYETLV